VAIVPVNVTMGMPHAGAVVRRGSRLDRISRVLWTNAECSLKTADDSTDGPAYHSANRSCRVIPDRSTVGNSIGNALRVGGQR
jgi:hypothetical protein